MNRSICLFLAICFMLSLTACMQAPNPTLPSAAATGTQPEESSAATTAPSIPDSTIQEGASAVYEAPMAAISLPLLFNSLKDDQGEEIAYYAHQDVSIVLPDADVAQVVTLDLLNKIDSTASAADAVFANAKADYKAQPDWLPYSYTVTYQPMRLDENILSLFGAEISFDSSPRSVHNAISATYDLTTGEALTLRTIFHEENFADAVCDIIIQTLAPRASELFADYESIIRSTFSTNVLNDSWYFSDDGLCFYFSPYEIAPYASGTIVSEIPYEKLSGLLKDAYFPGERLSYSGALIVTPLENGEIPETLTQFAEVTVTPGSEKLLLTTDGSISNIRLHYTPNRNGSTIDKTMILAAAGMGPTDAILMEIDTETAEYISVFFESYGAAQELYLTKNSAGNWVFSK